MNGIDRRAYPFESRFVDLPAGRVHYVDEGEGEPLLFVHGTPTWSFEWRHVIQALAPERRCIALDHLGFGLSDRPRDFSYTPEAHAANLARFVDALGLERLTLVVHDFGGPIGLPIALDRRDRVSGLVLLNTWMWSLEDDRRTARGARLLGGPIGRFLYRRLNLSPRFLLPMAFGDRDKLTPEIHRQYLDRFPDPWSREAVLWSLARSFLGSSAYYRSLWERRERLTGIPTLILWGMKDPAFGPKFLERWRDALPHARAVELAGVGHWPHEEAPERVVAELRALLAEGGA